MRCWQLCLTAMLLLSTPLDAKQRRKRKRTSLVDDEAKEPNTPATPQTPQSLALLQSPSGQGAQVMAPGRDNRLSKFKTFQSYNNELGMRGASTQSWVRLALQAITEGDERALRRIFQQTDTNVNVRVLFKRVLLARMSALPRCFWLG